MTFQSFDLAARLTDIKTRDLYRDRLCLTSAQGPWITLDGQHLQNFCSNDYLGLANDPHVIRAFQQAANRYGVGSGASHLVCGHMAVHHALEERLADFVGRPRALLFSSGYLANLGVMQALLTARDGLFQDKRNHASLLDAGVLCQAQRFRYPHAQTERLEQLLIRAHENGVERALVATDGVFSMDGDIAPLTELARLCQQYNAWLMVDDAHGLGCLGATGRGSLEQVAETSAQSIEPSIESDPFDFILMGTLGKAFGTAGAFVSGSEHLIELLIQSARTYRYTTALPPAVATATLKSLEIILAEPERRDQLNARIQQMRQGLSSLQSDFPHATFMGSDTAIQPLIIGDSARALAISEALQQRGFLVRAIRPPTVAPGTARLRITVTATHSTEQIDDLLNALVDVLSRSESQVLGHVFITDGHT